MIRKNVDFFHFLFIALDVCPIRPLTEPPLISLILRVSPSAPLSPPFLGAADPLFIN